MKLNHYKSNVNRNSSITGSIHSDFGEEINQELSKNYFISKFLQHLKYINYKNFLYFLYSEIDNVIKNIKL